MTDSGSAQQPPSRLDRVKGALLGVHAGDSLGATVEFASWESIRRTHPKGVRDIVGGGPFNWAPGHATDDTDLTRAVLLAYRDRHRKPAGEQADFDVVMAAGQHSLDWLEGRWPDRRPGSRPEDIGGATLTGLTRFKRLQDPTQCGAGMDQAGNGSLMRCIPSALFQPDFDKLVSESLRISALTHNDPRCTVSCAAYNVMVRALVNGYSPEEAVEAGQDVAFDLEEAEGGDGSPVQTAIKSGRRLKVRDMAENGPTALRGRGSGYVLESLTIAVSAVLDPRPLVDVLIDVVRIGADTDTNAAIAGGLLGARDGIQGLPEDWKSVLQFGSEFIELVDELSS